MSDNSLRVMQEHNRVRCVVFWCVVLLPCLPYYYYH